MNQNGFEIERKFLIRYPDLTSLEQAAERSEITQTYLLKEQTGCSERVRRRSREGMDTYTHTIKRHITDIRREEIEREISPEEYQELLKRADPKRRTIIKTRYCLPYQGMVFEIDIFPFWNDRAFLEVELEEEGQKFALPPMLQIIREVTSDKRYTNSALAKQIPEN